MKYLPYILWLAIITACGPKATIYDSAILIEHTNVIDAEQGLNEDVTVVIQGNKITAINPQGKIELSGDSKTIDGRGKYLIPGLWDAHVHFAYIEELAPYMFDFFLRYGITSVRDTGGKMEFVKEWKDKAEADPGNAPRVKIAGPLLDGMPNVYDGGSPSRPPLSVGASTVEDAVALVDYMDSMGVDLIKAYEMLSPEQFEAITARAKEKGLKVTGHVPLSMDVIAASDAGMNSMEHMRNLEMACAEDWETLREQRRQLLKEGRNDLGGILRSRVHKAQREHAVQNQSKANTANVLAALKRNQTWQIPTMSIVVAMTHRPFLNAEWQEDFSLLPPATEKRWEEGVERMSQLEVTTAAEEYSAWAFGMIDQVNQADIGIMAGTDCPIFFLTPGRSLHDELALLVKGGLTPLEAIESATLRPAQYFNMESELGTIATGKIADLLLLDANPLENIANTLAINTVIKDGHVHSPTKLKQNLKALNAK